MKQQQYCITHPQTSQPLLWLQQRHLSFHAPELELLCEAKPYILVFFTLNSHSWSKIALTQLVIVLPTPAVDNATTFATFLTVRPTRRSLERLPTRHTSVPTRQTRQTRLTLQTLQSTDSTQHDCLTQPRLHALTPPRTDTALLVWYDDGTSRAHGAQSDIGAGWARSVRETNRQTERAKRAGQRN